MSILMINKVEVKQEEQGTSSIKMKVFSNFPKTTKVHILA